MLDLVAHGLIVVFIIELGWANGEVGAKDRLAIVLYAKCDLAWAISCVDAPPLGIVIADETQTLCRLSIDMAKGFTL